MRSFFRSFRPDAQPLMVRPTYARELVTSMTMPASIAMIEGGVVGILAVKVFNVSDALFATIMAAPMFAHLTSFLWARLARGISKVPVIVILMSLSALCVASIGLVPQTPVGTWIFVGLMILARCLLAGVVTLRSAVWRNNYPREVRATVTGKLTLVSSIVVVVVPYLGYLCLDYEVELFRLVYPLSAILAVAGIYSFSKVRLRNERELLAYERSPGATPQPHGMPGPVYEYNPIAQKHNFWTVMKRDYLFRYYMICQMIAGGSNMMSEITVVYLVVTLTAGRSDAFSISILLTTAIPMAMSILLIPVWGRFFDKTHAAHFRARQNWVWIADQVGNLTAALLGSLWVLAVSRVLQGTARAAGQLAWNLGHNDFADRRLVALYMGIHVTLTGVRGAIVPFAAVLLYNGWGSDALAFTGAELPAFGGVGPWLFAMTGTGMVVSHVGFSWLSRTIRRAEREGRPTRVDMNR